MSGIFLSYRRRGESAGYAGRLAAELQSYFGADRLFRDIDKIEPGLDFVEVITSAVASCTVLIAVIGEDWLTATDAAGRRRLDDPQDFLHLEVATALSRNVRVIPVLVGQATMPGLEDLPDSLKPLARRQAHELSDTRWDYDVKQLIATLENAGIHRRSTPEPPQPFHQRKAFKWALRIGSAVALAATGWIAWRVLFPPGPAALPVVLSFEAAPPAIGSGASSTLRWRSSNATRVELDGRSVDLSGSAEVRPDKTTTYVLTIWNNRGRVDTAVTVGVTSPVVHAPSPVVPSLEPSGPSSIPVPDVRQLSLDAARSRLAEAGLQVGRMSFYTLEGYSRGTVYRQETAPGTSVRPGTGIGLFITRERLPGIQSSGQMYLSPSEVWDLDGERASTRQDHDIRFDAASATERYLEPTNGAEIGAVGRTRVDRNRCAVTPLSSSRVLLDVGSYFCARTNRGRYSLLRIDDLSSELKLSFDTWQSDTSHSTSPQTADNSGARLVRLGSRESYHFRSGIRGKLSGGDLYVIIEQNGAAQFWANNQSQRGLVDKGNIGDVPLTQVSAPRGGFYQFGVPVAFGHTYVSLARAGEEGHFIVFRVIRMTSDWVILSYIYR